MKNLWLKIILLILLLNLNINAQNKASYYASNFHGKLTASGIKFNNNLLTCAHKYLPFGTLLKVTNIKNNKSVLVIVTDRGPFVKNRVIDLSQEAFRKISSITQGVCEVIIEEILWL